MRKFPFFFSKGESKRTPCEKSVAFAYLRSIPPLLRSRQHEIEMDLSQFSEKQKTILEQVRELILVFLPFCVVQCCNAIKMYRHPNYIWILLSTFPCPICVINELLMIERWKCCIIDLLFTSTFQGMLPHQLFCNLTNIIPIVLFILLFLIKFRGAVKDCQLPNPEDAYLARWLIGNATY